MAIVTSDNFIYKNPKPPQEYDRYPLGGGLYRDWISASEIDTFFATTTGLSPTYKNNKYFWIAGAYYQFDGANYRPISGTQGAVQDMIFTCPSTSGTINVPSLAGYTIVSTLFAGTTYDSAQITLASDGTLDATSIGGFYSGYLLTILYK